MTFVLPSQDTTFGSRTLIPRFMNVVSSGHPDRRFRISVFLTSRVLERSIMCSTLNCFVISLTELISFLEDRLRRVSGQFVMLHLRDIDDFDHCRQSYTVEVITKFLLDDKWSSPSNTKLMFRAINENKAKITRTKVGAMQVSIVIRRRLVKRKF